MQTRDYVLAARLAADAVNADPALLAPHTIQLAVLDDQGQPWRAMRAVCELARQGVQAIIGPAYSSASIPALRITTALQLPQVSYAATSPKLAGPHFARVTPSDTAQGPAFVAVAKEFGWNRICIVFQENAYASAGALETHAAVSREEGMEVLSIHGYPDATRNASAALKLATTARCRIFVGWCGGAHSDDCEVLMKHADDAGLVQGGDYVWMLSDGCQALLQRRNALQSSGFNPSFGDRLVGTLCVAPNANTAASAIRADLDSDWAAARTADNSPAPGPFSHFMFDAVLAAAHGLNAVAAAQTDPFTLAATDDCVPSLDAATAAWPHGPAISEALENVSFVGVTGNVSFVPNTLERAMVSYGVHQLHPGFENLSSKVYETKFVEIGQVDGAEIEGELNIVVGSSIRSGARWSTPRNRDPTKTPCDELPSTVRVHTKIVAPWTTLKDECVPGKCLAATIDGRRYHGCPVECFGGLAMEALEKVAEKANFKYNISYSNGGYKVADVEADLESSDILVGDWTATAVRSGIAQLVYPYVDTGLILMRRARDLDAATNNAGELLSIVFKPFSREVWFAIFFGCESPVHLFLWSKGSDASDLVCAV
jgi:ABC-type branched-subunit amino acid transport system substrate-binding protein